METDDQTALSSAGPAEPRSIDAARMMACGSCGRVVQAGDAFCRYCGKALSRKKRTAWYYEPVWLLILGFVVIGPLAIPLVIRSPKLNGTAKWALSIAIAIYTLVGAYYLYVLCAMIWNITSQEMEQLRAI